MRESASEEREREALQQFGAFSYPNHRNERGSRNNKDKQTNGWCSTTTTEKWEGGREED